MVKLATAVRLLLWGTVEAVWNVYPPRAWTSALLLGCHVTLLAALWARPLHIEPYLRVQQERKTK